MDPAKLWYTLAFVIFFAMLARPLVGGGSKKLDGYIKQAQDTVEQARKLHLQAQETVLLYRHQQQSIQDEAARVIEQAKQDAVQMKAAALKQLEEDEVRRRTAMNARIANTKQQVMDDLQAQTAADIVRLTTLMLQQAAMAEYRKKSVFDAAKNLHLEAA